jgi:hypothetical protein
LRLFLPRLREGESIVYLHFDKVRSFLKTLPKKRKGERANIDAARRRGAEILRATDKWKRATAIAARESGFLESEKAVLSICAKQGHLQRRIAATPARTVVCALTKIELAAPLLTPIWPGLRGRERQLDRR